MIVAFTLNRFLRPRAKITHSVLRDHVFLVREPLRDPQGNVLSPNQVVNTASYWIFNGGNETAKNVEVTFNWQPLFLNVYPHRHFEELIAPDNRFSLRLTTLAPSEGFGIELMNINADLPMLCGVRSDECESVETKMSLQAEVAQHWKIVIFALLLLGIGSVAYFLAVLVQLLAGSAPA